MARTATAVRRYIYQLVQIDTNVGFRLTLFVLSNTSAHVPLLSFARSFSRAAISSSISAIGFPDLESFFNDLMASSWRCFDNNLVAPTISSLSRHNNACQSTYHRGDSGSKGQRTARTNAGTNWIPTGICQPALLGMVLVRRFTKEAINEPKTIINWMVAFIMPRSSRGLVSAR